VVVWRSVGEVSMSLSSAIQDVLEADSALMAILTGGVFIEVEEISRQNTAGAFDANGEIQPCALIKLGVETKTGPHATSVRTPMRIYFYERQGYENIYPAMDIVFNLLNDQQIGERVWIIEFSSDIKGQRDQALDCALGSQIWTAIRNRQ
jgi:hypothetical protein